MSAIRIKERQKSSHVIDILINRHTSHSLEGDRDVKRKRRCPGARGLREKIPKPSASMN